MFVIIPWACVVKPAAAEAHQVSLLSALRSLERQKAGVFGTSEALKVLDPQKAISIPLG